MCDCALTKTNTKRGNKKYGHLQERSVEEENGEEKSLLDLNAQVFTHF